MDADKYFCARKETRANAIIDSLSIEGERTYTIEQLKILDPATAALLIVALELADQTAITFTKKGTKNEPA